MIWSDLEYFSQGRYSSLLENSWLTPRSYGGERRHEGTDIFASRNISNYYPIISITDGIIEQKGWLPLGGYRIGIRSEQCLFITRTLPLMNPDPPVGDTVSTGDILGLWEIRLRRRGTVENSFICIWNLYSPHMPLTR